MSNNIFPVPTLESLREIVRPYTQHDSDLSKLLDRCEILIAIYGISQYARREAAGHYDRLCANCGENYGIHTFAIAACPYPHTTLFSVKK